MTLPSPNINNNNNSNNNHNHNPIPKKYHSSILPRHHSTFHVQTPKMNYSLLHLTTTTMLLSLFIIFCFSTTLASSAETISFSSILTSLTLPRRNSTSSLYSNKINAAPRTQSKPRGGTTSSSSSSSYYYRSSFKYSVALVVSLPIGTPPQMQQMVLDTGSQLSWIQCNQKSQHTHSTAGGAATPSTTTTNTTFNPSLSSSFSVLPCNHPICKPRTPDFTLPTSCDQNSLCHYSYFFADGTFAEGNLVREKFTFSSSQTSPPLTLGCASKSSDDKGILGMNLGRLSFPSQAKVSKFSYCVPPRPRAGSSTTGSFFIGQNPNSGTFRYVPFMSFGPSQRMPNLDPLAYTVAMQGIRIGGKRLNISEAAFRPDAGGSGQTMVDSGSEFTYLVDDAYGKVKEEVVRLVGPKMKKGYVAEGVLEMCFDEREAAGVRRVMGSMTFEFEKGVEIAAEGGKLLADMGDGAYCVPVAMSSTLGAASNIIGNFHQQNMWVEFDLTNRRMGLGTADCTRS